MKKKKKPHCGKVSQVTHLDDKSSMIELTLTEPLGFVGGQYVIVNTKIPLGEKHLKRAYTIISTDSEQSKITLAMPRIGRGSHFMCNLKVGAEVEFGGPYGKFKPYPEMHPDWEVTLVVTDTGINAAIGLLQGQALRGLTERCRLYWLKGEGQDYLNDGIVRELLPHDIEHFETTDIAPVKDPRRLVEGHKYLDRILKREPGGPVYLAGDGLLVDAFKRRALGVGRLENHVITEFFFDKPKAPDGPKKGMREGYTTGACSAAAAKAAARFLVTGDHLDVIHSTLPNGQKVAFPLHKLYLEPTGLRAVCSIIKDGGDDPDVTHGAEMVATVELKDEGGIELFGGQGVAVVTKPGLGLDVGGPAINPVPSKNISEMVTEELFASDFSGAKVTISVPDGEERAKHTLNARLGLLNGISILGTTGIVKPYSTAAFVASVVQGIELAKVQGADTVVFTTGGRSEAYAMKLLPELGETSFIQVGDYIGIGIRNSARQKIRLIHIVGMMGKLSKMADGKMMTHASKSEVNMAMLAQLAKEAGAPPATVSEVRQANTARHVYEICQKAGIDDLPDRICQRTEEMCTKFARSPVEIRVTMVDFSGNVIGKGHSNHQQED